MASKTNMGQFLKKKGSSQIEAAKVLGITESVFSIKARGWTDREKEKLAEHYSMTDEEVLEVFGE